MHAALRRALLGGGYCAEANSLFARFTVQPYGGRKRQIDRLIRSLKTAGVWSKLDALYLMAAHDEQAAQRNWVADGFNLTANNSPAFARDRGYTGNGSNSNLDSEFNPTTASSPKFTQDDASMWLWSRTDLRIDASNASAEIGNANSRMSRSNVTAGVALGRPNTGSTINTMVTAGFPGFLGWARSAAAVWESYAQGADAGGGTDASAALTNASFYIGAVNGIGSGVNEIAAAAWGQNLTATEALAFYQALHAYMAAVGAL